LGGVENFDIDLTGVRQTEEREVATTAESET